MVYVLDAFRPVMDEMVKAASLDGFTVFVIGATLRDVTPEDEVNLPQEEEGDSFILQVDVVWDSDDCNDEEMMQGTLTARIKGSISAETLNSLMWN